MRVHIKGPSSLEWMFSFTSGRMLTKNQAEYEALVRGLRLLRSLGVMHAQAHTDSQLVCKQQSGEYVVHDPELKCYHDGVKALSSDFRRCDII